MNVNSASKGARLGILGGTFNPIHNAHLAIARAATEHFHLDEVLFVPAHTPPHKGEQQVSTEQRMRMLQLALGGHAGFRISTVELERQGVSYTIDTIRALREEDPSRELCFIIGDDSLVQLHSWKSIHELMKLCRFITVSRPGIDVDQLCQNIHFDSQTVQQLLADRTEACNLNISSTMIREYVREGRSIQHLVPTEVAKYIRDNKLYLE
ncbi:nicotinate-nucleotide adenylyltransferase [Verrucomicrobiota bacterium]